MRKLLRRSIWIVGGVAASLALLFTALAFKASARLAQTHHTHPFEQPLPDGADQAAIQRGKHLAHSRYACTACHGVDLGGGTMIDDPAIGAVLGPNITRGAGSATHEYSMQDWDHIVRHGIKPDSTGSLMPSGDYFQMSDQELSDLVAYARAVPPVDRSVPPPSLGPVGKVLVATGKLPISAEKQSSGAHPQHPPAEAESVEFGRHLSAVCTGCHRATLAGGPMEFGPPDWPAAANLTPHVSGLGNWSYEDFDRALVEGLTKDGRTMRAPMSDVIASTRGLSTTEKKALWTYLQSLPATPSE